MPRSAPPDSSPRAESLQIRPLGRSSDSDDTQAALVQLTRGWWRVGWHRLAPDSGEGRPAEFDAPPNGVCASVVTRPALASRCASSLRDAARVAGTDGSPAVSECHLGFGVWAQKAASGHALAVCGVCRIGGPRPWMRSLGELPPDRGAAAVVELDLPDQHRLSEVLRTLVSREPGAEASGSLQVQRAGRAGGPRTRPAARSGAAVAALGAIVGATPEMQALRHRLERVAPTSVTVLIRGENGSGKELVARALHALGPRPRGPFVAVNCAAFPEGLLESELFGHVRGAFTGAHRDRRGLWDEADGGTLFLDEIGDMPPLMQVKILRALQEGAFTPVGDTQPRVSTARIVAATHRPLERMVADGTFREDLWYRLNVIQLEIPPLRERIDDVPLLCEQILGRLARRTGVPSRVVDPALLRLLQRRSWPGNVRELENTLERLSILAGDDQPLTVELYRSSLPAATAAQAPQLPRSLVGGTLDVALAELERQMVAQALHAHDGNRSRTAAALGVSRTTLLKKIAEFGLEGR